ncbi:MAG: hypothetical protein ACQEW9_17430 [Bacteroidota bacterium]|uniref:Uncharacterized protein n=1 Tax=Algoriphagus faecimaris TaxID=686796 RepID=A0A1G6WPZ9_9BACT|nr:hypothetical protein [Algoriphagus faecimaris]SDD67849.1 hypothetical protein SAMN04488104_104631 [Algoriphagus faecimaris]
MTTRIEFLRNKYYAAETSLAEEQELRALLRESEGYEEDKMLFGLLEAGLSAEPDQLTYPKSRKSITLNFQWLGWAAALVVMVGSLWMYRGYVVQQREEAAFREVMQALSIVQGNLERGRDQLDPLKELRYLNTPQELFDLDQ